MTISAESVKWSVAKTRLPESSASFVALLDQLILAKGLSDLELLKLKCGYGDLIVEDGKWKIGELPAIGGRSRTLTDADFAYSNIPLVLVMRRVFEVWSKRSANVERRKEKKEELPLPLVVAYPGTFLGLFENFTPMSEKKWNVSAGSRSVFIATPLELRTLFSEFSDLELAEPTLAAGEWARFPIFQHWDFIKAVVNHGGGNWDAELLVFDRELFGFLRRDQKINVALNHAPSTSSKVETAEQKLLAFFNYVAIDQLSYMADRLQLHDDAKTESELYPIRTAARILGIVRGHLPVMTPVRHDEDELLSASSVCTWLAQKLNRENKQLLKNQDHAFVMIAADNLQRAQLGYQSLGISFAEYDWPRDLLGMNALRDTYLKLRALWNEADFRNTLVTCIVAKEGFRRRTAFPTDPPHTQGSGPKTSWSPLEDSRLVKNLSSLVLRGTKDEEGATNPKLSLPEHFFFEHMIEFRHGAVINRIVK